DLYVARIQADRAVAVHGLSCRRVPAPGSPWHAEDAQVQRRVELVIRGVVLDADPGFAQAHDDVVLAEHDLMGDVGERRGLRLIQPVDGGELLLVTPQTRLPRRP